MFDVKFVFLYTDAVLWVLLAVVVFYAWRAARMPLVARKWRRVLANKTALAPAACARSVQIGRASCRERV